MPSATTTRPASGIWAMLSSFWLRTRPGSVRPTICRSFMRSFPGAPGGGAGNSGYQADGSKGVYGNHYVMHGYNPILVCVGRRFLALQVFSKYSVLRLCARCQGSKQNTPDLT